MVVFARQPKKVGVITRWLKGWFPLPVIVLSNKVLIIIIIGKGWGIIIIIDVYYLLYKMLHLHECKKEMSAENKA